MSFSSYDPHTRYRRRSIDRFVRFAFTTVVLLFAGGVGFWLGQQGDAQRVSSLKQRLADIEAQKSKAEAVLMELRTEAQTATMRYERLQSDIKEQVPDGPMQELVALLRKQLEEGMDPARLSFAIRSARPPRNCSEAETRRFVVTTPAYQGSESAVEIAESGISVSGKGVSVKNKEGKPEAWYDPAKQVSISFKVRGVEERLKTGVMPLRHSIVVGAREYRFSIEPGARSFAKVTFDSCDYP